MSAVVSNPPRGLYSLLGLRDMGDVPREVSAQVVTTIDISQFLLLNRETTFSTPIPTGGAPGWKGIGNVRVPPGELWYVHELGLEGTVGAGITGKVAVGYAENDGAPVVVGDIQSAGAGEIIASSRTADPFWAVPGATFPYLCLASAGGSFNCSLTLIVTRLRI